jgi:4-carboxymuconolactone decarboxylase
MSDRDLYDAGLAVRREVLGAEYVDRALQRREFNRPMQDLVSEYCWGAIWTREGLDRKTRSLINLAMLTALRQWNELELHLRGAVNNGLTDEQIQEALLQATIYCGVPAGVEAFKIADRVLLEHRASVAAGGEATGS